MAFSAGIHNWVCAEQTSLPLSEERYREASKRFGKILGEKSKDDSRRLCKCRTMRVGPSWEERQSRRVQSKIQIDASLMCSSLHCSATWMRRSRDLHWGEEKHKGLFVLNNLFISLCFKLWFRLLCNLQTLLLPIRQFFFFSFSKANSGGFQDVNTMQHHSRH